MFNGHVWQDIKLVRESIDGMNPKDNPEVFDCLVRVLDMLKHQKAVQRKSHIKTNQIIYDVRQSTT